MKTMVLSSYGKSNLLASFRPIILNVRNMLEFEKDDKWMIRVVCSNEEIDKHAIQKMKETFCSLQESIGHYSVYHLKLSKTRTAKNAFYIDFETTNETRMNPFLNQLNWNLDQFAQQVEELTTSLSKSADFIEELEEYIDEVEDLSKKIDE